MTYFDPNAEYETTIPAGSYIIAMVWCERKISQAKGNPYMRAKYEILGGPAKGETFFDAVSINGNSKGAMSRLAMFAKSVGLTQGFDLDDEAAFRSGFLNKPFKAQLKTEKSNGYVNTSVERYVMQLDPVDQDIIDAWVMDASEKRAFGEQEARKEFGDDEIPF